MNSPTPIISVIVPAKNGMPHLPLAIASLLSSPSDGLEVILSIDDSQDGSEVALLGLSDSRLKIIRPPAGLSMSEHWDFAQMAANGQWQMFLGQDDLMRKGFFDRCIGLILEAESLGIEAVVARRAYVYWPNTNSWSRPAVQFWSSEARAVVDSKKFVTSAFFSDISYHAGPQMYTSSLVSASLLKRIRDRNNGKLILGHPQDAFLAAEILNQTGSFLFSGDPISFVGTSKNSAGLAIAQLAGGKVGALISIDDNLASSYIESVSKSSLSLGGGSEWFKHGANNRYFYDAWQKVSGEDCSLDSLGQAERFKFDQVMVRALAHKRLSATEFARLRLSSLPLWAVKSSAILTWTLGLTGFAAQQVVATVLHPLLRSTRDLRLLRRAKTLKDVRDFLQEEDLASFSRD